MESLPALRNAWVMGGTAWALGHPPSHFTTILAWRERPQLAVAWIYGYWTKHNRRNWAVDAENFVCFDMKRLEGETVKRIIDANRARKEREMTTRSQEELTQLRNEFNETYNGDAAFADAAFADHLANLDAGATVEEAAKAKTSTPKKVAGKKGGAKKAAAPKAAKAVKAVKAAKAPKAPAAPKAKAFRPTSDDRKAFNAAAAKVVGKDATARLVPAGGKATYTDFLQGKVLKLDADGSGATVLNVVTAKDAKTVLGTVTVTVTKGKVKATGAKK